LWVVLACEFHKWLRFPRRYETKIPLSWTPPARSLKVCVMIRRYLLVLADR
jgi:hypothetical protein